MKVLVTLPATVFNMKNHSLYTNWAAATDQFIAEVKPLLASGCALGVMLGDEIVCGGMPMEHLDMVSARLKKGLGATSWIYTNEADCMLDPSKWIPAGLDAISLDFCKLSLSCTRSVDCLISVDDLAGYRRPAQCQRHVGGGQDQADLRAGGVSEAASPPAGALCSGCLWLLADSLPSDGVRAATLFTGSATTSTPAAATAPGGGSRRWRGLPEGAAFLLQRKHWRHSRDEWREQG